MMDQPYDFSGYATKVGKKCSDGRTILKDAFVHNDGGTVPLVWQHLHDTPTNIIGRAILENRVDGVYAYCSLNGSESAQAVKEAVMHGDITALSIFANSLVEKGKNVIHGTIREVSLVISGANPEAYIDNLAFAHGDGEEIVVDSTEAIISAGDKLLFHATDKKEVVMADDKMTDDEDLTVADVFETLTEMQKTMVYVLLGQAMEEGDSNLKQSNIEKGANDMKSNVFNNDEGINKAVLTHDAMQEIITFAKKNGSLKEAFLAHADTYGINDIGFLFPDAKSVTGEPMFIGRKAEWVSDVFGKAHHSPFSRIKSVFADITPIEARAKGYVTGAAKTDEVFALLKRITTPTTIYKKQKLDRDDVLDITDFDVVGWLKMEMRMMLDEELSRAILVGDGRSVASDDKIPEANIRPIYSDADLYSIKLVLAADQTTSQIIDGIVLARKDYKGSGNPVFFGTPDIVGDMLLLKDTTGRRIYPNMTDLAAALRVSKIVEVPVLENVLRNVVVDTTDAALLGIVVNMTDYYVGADKGGSVNMFDDFDIDYNQYKYLIETRCSGALVVPHSAIVVEKLQPFVGG